MLIILISILIVYSYARHGVQCCKWYLSQAETRHKHLWASMMACIRVPRSCITPSMILLVSAVVKRMQGIIASKVEKEIPIVMIMILWHQLSTHPLVNEQTSLWVMQLPSRAASDVINRAWRGTNPSCPDMCLISWQPPILMEWSTIFDDTDVMLLCPHCWVLRWWYYVLRW